MKSYQHQSSQQKVVLAYWRQNDKLQLEQNTLQNINNFVLGQIAMACFQIFQQKHDNVNSVMGKTISKPPDLDNCILISSSPMFYPKVNKYLYMLQILANSQQAKQSLHLFVALFCTVIVVLTGNQQSLNYLTTINKRVNINANNHNQIKTALLLCIQLLQNEYSPQFLTQSTDKLMNRFQIYGMYNQMIASYPMIKGLQCPRSSYENPSKQFQQKMTQQLQTMGIYCKKNNEIMYGPILAQYLYNICEEYNTKNGTIPDLQKLLDNIEIDEGYEAYVAGVKQFHKTSLKLFNKNQKLDGNQLQEILGIAKMRAFQQFYQKGGSSNFEYRKILQDYIAQKNKEIIIAYSFEQRNNNLQILENESKIVLERITKSKIHNDQEIKTYIDQMGKNYQNQAQGPEKYSIYNQYMKVFAPIAYQPDQSKQSMLIQQQNKNKQLKKQKAQLQYKKDKGKCCSIM